MALYHQSTIQWPSAVQAIADSVGASADSEMLNRAHLSLRAAFQHFNSRARWNFLRAEAPPKWVLAPFSFGVTCSSNVATVSAAIVPATDQNVAADDLMNVFGFPPGVRVSATADGGGGGSVVITMNTSATGFSGTAAATATATRDMYDLPSDYRDEYVVKLLVSNVTLRYINRRIKDRGDPNEISTDNPYRYDLFTVGSRGKIRLIRPPLSADVMLNRYYRRMFLASASAVASAIDIPEDYESYPIAWAKWHFLTDKGEGRKDQAMTWLSLAQEGLKTMLADQTVIADEDLQFVPGHASTEYDSTSTRSVIWDY